MSADATKATAQAIELHEPQLVARSLEGLARETKSIVAGSIGVQCMQQLV